MNNEPSKKNTDETYISNKQYVIQIAMFSEIKKAGVT